MYFYRIKCFPLQKSRFIYYKSLKNKKKLNFIRSLHIIFSDELGQNSAENIATYDTIIIYIRNSNIFMGIILIMGTLDHIQIKSMNGSLFLLTNSNSIFSS